MELLDFLAKIFKNDKSISLLVNKIMMIKQEQDLALEGLCNKFCKSGRIMRVLGSQSRDVYFLRLPSNPENKIVILT